MTRWWWRGCWGDVDYRLLGVVLVGGLLVVWRRSGQVIMVDCGENRKTEDEGAGFQ